MRLSGKVFVFCVLPLAALLLAGCKPGAKSNAQVQACQNACMAEHKCDLSFENNPHRIGEQCLIVQNDCMTRCGGQTSSDDMKNRIPVTLPPPVDGSTSNPLRPGTYGAIAYSKQTNSWGASAASIDKKSVESNAMDFCSQRGAGCVIVDSFSNACVAVALGADNTIKWAHAPTPAAARMKAQADCAKKSNDSCAIQFWQCYPDSLGKPPAAVGNPKKTDD